MFSAWKAIPDLHHLLPEPLRMASEEGKEERQDTKYGKNMVFGGEN